MTALAVPVRRRLTVYVLVALLTLAGGYAYVTLPREASPDIAIPLVIVTTPYIGASPQDVESLVTRYVEKQLQGLEGVKEIRSNSIEGVSNIEIEFDPSVDIDAALRKVKDKVDLARQDLPADVEDSIVQEINLSEVPILIVALSGNVGLVDLKAFGDDLADEIEAIRGVLEVQVNGGLTREIQIDIDPARLAAYNLSVQDVVDVVGRENVTLPAGSVAVGGYKYAVRVPAQLSTVTDVEDLIIKAGSRQPVYISDVAQVRDGFADPTSMSRLDQQPSVSLSVIKRSGENLIAIADEVKALTQAWEPRFPPGVKATILADQSDDIRMMVLDLENNILSGLLLVVAVLFLFMGVRNALFVGLAIPMSMLISFAVLSLMGVTLNMVVLFSLILALGMLVDNGIVIVENIFRHRQLGADPEAAAITGASEVAIAVSASTLTTLCAFGPMLFWPGIIGEFMSYLPLTLIVTLASSLFVALIINPAVCASLMTVKASYTASSAVDWTLVRYRTVLAGALDRPWFSMLAAIGSLVFVVAVYGIFNHGVEFFPKTEPGKAYVNIEAPSGTDLASSDQLVRAFEERLVAVTDVASFVTSVGTGGPHESRITIDFAAQDARSRKGQAIVADIRAIAADVAGAVISVDEESTGPPTGAPISIEVLGEDFEELARIITEVKRRAAAVAGVVDLRDDLDDGRPEARIRIDRRAAALAGLNTSSVANAVRASVHGVTASQFRDGEDEYDIRVRYDSESRGRLEDLDQVRIEKDDRLVPLSAVASMEIGSGLGGIRRKDLKRVITVEGKVDGRTTGEALAEVQQSLAGLQLPSGYHIRYGGENEDQGEAAAFLSKAFIIAVFLIGMVLITQFNSLMTPLVIITSVVLSLIGVLVGLLVTGTPFGVMMTGIGVISLAGVVVNNAIVLIDYAQQLIRGGMAIREAIIEAGIVRFRPVLLTAITTVLGLIPLSTGVSFDFFSLSLEVGGRSSQYWGPMAIAVIFGLAFATLLTLLVVPVMLRLIWRTEVTPTV